MIRLVCAIAGGLLAAVPARRVRAHQLGGRLPRAGRRCRSSGPRPRASHVHRRHHRPGRRDASGRLEPRQRGPARGNPARHDRPRRPRRGTARRDAGPPGTRPAPGRRGARPRCPSILLHGYRLLVLIVLVSLPVGLVLRGYGAGHSGGVLFGTGRRARAARRRQASTVYSNAQLPTAGAPPSARPALVWRWATQSSGSTNGCSSECIAGNPARSSVPRISP